ncbi:unnamed protein product [Sphagnum jensenii]|uniref:Cytochrome b5 heme-binding domain-containing protein n=1 Tax=Sphagnum jensenii TaxID=128206 RepID=A0ABP1AQ11_9BRYO
MVEEDHHHQQHKLNGVAEPENVTREDDDDVAAAQRRSMGVAAEAVQHHNIEPLTILPAVLPSSCSSSSTFSVPQFTPPANPALKPTTTRSRAKVPLENGYSQMVWLKLLRTEPDLAGLKGKSNKRLIPIAEVKQHCTEEDAWTVLRGCVYNISPYIRFHPGGRDMLMKGAGKDCTSLFMKYHAWVNADFLLEKCLVGVLDVPLM